MPTWKVDCLRVVPELNSHENVVVSVTWQVDALRGVTEFAAPGDPFTAFKDLTEAQVLDWVWAQTSKVDWEAKAAALAALPSSVESVVVPLPWS